MKKFRFVIPKVLTIQIIFKLTRILFIVIIQCFITVKLFAHPHDYGCKFGSRIFQNYDTLHLSLTNFQMDSDGNGAPNGFAVVDDKCDNGETTECFLYDKDENFVGIGFLADFSIDYCPIDDYVFTLFIFTLTVGLYRLLKPTFPMPP